MKIYVASDLHKEFGVRYTYPNQRADVCVLAGDINAGVSSVETAKRYQDEIGIPIILIAGNHEFYRGDFDRTLANIRAEASKHQHIHFLENEEVEFNGVRFLGCTLWTNFGLYGRARRKQAMLDAETYINDFRLITYGDRWVTPADMMARFGKSYMWLRRQLAEPYVGKTVVLTHFAPHPAAIHERYKVGDGDMLTPYFTPNCRRLFQQFKIDLWIYGHTHNSVDTIVENGTRLVSNQGGYPNENSAYTQFDLQKIIEL